MPNLNAIVMRIKHLKKSIRLKGKMRKEAKEKYKIRDEIILNDINRPTKKDFVNIHYWKKSEKEENLGDYLSKVVVNYYAPHDEYGNLLSVGG